MKANPLGAEFLSPDCNGGIFNGDEKGALGSRLLTYMMWHLAPYGLRQMERC
jgi:hypothetical protein